jgi:hypothetical protein
VPRRSSTARTADRFKTEVVQLPTPNRDLKKLSVEFRSIAGATLRSDDAQALRNLRRLVDFVERTPLLSAVVLPPSVSAEDVTQRFEQAKARRGRHIDMPDDPIEEVRLRHTLLNLLANSGEPSFWKLTYGYGNAASKRNINDHVEAAMHELVGPYVTHLNGVVELALLDSADPAYGPARSVNIEVSGHGNQFNVAKDQASLEATQQIGATGREIVQLATALMAQAELARADGVDPEACTDVMEVAEAVAAEMKKERPSRFTLKSAVEKLELLASGTSTLATLARYAAPLLELLRARLAAL